MNISVTFRNTGGEDWQKEYIHEKLKKIKRYVDSPAEAHVILSVEKFRNTAEINLMVDGLNVNAKEEAKDMSLAMDNAVEKIERQLKKHKEKIRGHKVNSVRDEKIGAMELPTDDTEEDASEAKVVETRKIVLKPMSLEDAIMEIEMSKNRFIIYRDSYTENVSVIYRRDDGHYGLIETNT
ncbi:MAG: ribosome-associated translation inhibitor RaiA [Syntrophales bacterium]|nr:ribosome-associated translation inhibitor RaiA [Syntrophales bacterium]